MAIKKNIIFSIFQVLVNGVVLFFAYKFFIQALGASQLGEWALIFSIVALINIVSAGFTESAIRHVSKHLALNESEKLAQVIQTIVVSVVFIQAGIFFFIFPLLKIGISYLIHDVESSKLNLLLLEGFLVLLTSTIGGIYSSCLDGHQRVDQRASLNIVSNIIFLLLSIFIVKKIGIYGIGLALIISHTFLIISASYFVRIKVAKLPKILYKWKFHIFKEVLKSGFNLQVASLSISVTDPLVKILLANFGSLQDVTYYDMANRLASQCRNVLNSANQVLVPYITKLSETKKNKVAVLYSDTYRLNFVFSMAVFSILIIFSQTIGELWLGNTDQIFTLYICLFSITFFINSLIAPIYFYNIALGQFKINTYGFIAIVLIILTFSVPLGKFYGGIGVVTAFCIGQVIGSIIILKLSYKKYGFRFSMINGVKVGNRK